MPNSDEPSPNRTPPTPAADRLPVAHRLEHLANAVSAAAPRDRDPARRADAVALLRTRVSTPAEATAVVTTITARLCS